MARACQPTWLDAYLQYTEGQESPDDFHLWVALAVMSATLERNVWLPRGYYTLYPNLYVVLVGGSAIVHKTVAINIGRGLLEALNPKPLILAQKLTVERMIQAMGSHVVVNGTRVKPYTSAMILASELSVFLSRAAFEGGMLSVLTDLYDCPEGEWSYETKSGGRDVLFKPSLTLLGGTTPVWLKASVPDDAVGGGFLSRTVFVYSEAPRDAIAFPEVSEGALALRERLVADLGQMQKLRGPFSWTPEAHALYGRWYPEERSRIHGSPLGEFVVRRPDTVLKVAMLMSIAESDELVLKPHHIEAAIGLLDRVEANLPNVYGPLVTKPEQDVVVRVVEVLKRYRVITRKKLIGLLWRYGDANRIASAIDTLEQAGFLKGEMVKGGDVVLKWQRLEGGSTIEQSEG